MREQIQHEDLPDGWKLSVEKEESGEEYYTLVSNRGAGCTTFVADCDDVALHNMLWAMRKRIEELHKEMDAEDPLR